VRLAAALIVVLGLIADAGCGREYGSGGGLRVVATTTQVADFVRAVGGTRVEVAQILTPKSDPHEYEPVPSDARALSEAAVVVRSGGDLDSWLEGVLDNAPAGARIVTLSDHVRRRAEHGEFDPHWWQDPRNAILAVGALRDALAQRDPGGRAAYERRAAAYVRRLRRLDRGIARCMASVPAARRKLVTTHDALGYFARRYGVEVVGALIPSLSTQAQPSARDIQQLVSQIRSEGVETIFPESALNPKLEQAVSREAHAQVGKRLWADSLGPKGSSGATYIESMIANTEDMVEGMTGGRDSCRP
jgi:zinc/manganese transport system substrate-binding protein